MASGLHNAQAMLSPRIALAVTALVVLGAACAPPESPSGDDCSSLSTHAAELRAEARAARSPERDRAQHRAALVAAIVPALRNACERLSAAGRECVRAASTVQQLNACAEVAR
jgi:hypothetical protein